MLGTVLVVLLILMFVGALPTLATQPKLGLLPERRRGLGAGDSGHPALARPNLSKLSGLHIPSGPNGTERRASG